MNIRRIALSATILSVAFLASAVPVNATVPPTEPPPAAETAPTAQPPVIEESWALSPAGSLEADAAAQRPDLTYEADPGAVIEDAVTLFNFGTVQLTFRIYATDAFNNADGQFDLLSGDQQPVDVGSWVTLPQEMVTVPPGKQVTLPITIKIPAGTTPGDHTGAILASNQAIGAGPEGGAVTLDRRTGTRLYLRVNGPLFPELAVANVETTYHQALNSLGGSADVTYRIENRGNVRLAGAASVTIAGPFGLGERKVELPNVSELLPGEDVEFTVTVEDVSALMVAFTTVRLEPANGASASASASTGDDTTFVPPLTVLLAMLFVLFGVLARRSYVRHRVGTIADDASSSEAPRPREHQPA